MASETRVRRRRPLLKILAVVVVLLVAAGVGVWYFLIREDAPERANIEAAAETLDESGAGDTEVDPADLVGEWTVDTSVGSFDDFSGTWAGYRFDEELASIGATTAVGRTPDVSGTMTVTETEVTAVDIEVDMTTLQSDQDRRDNAIRSRGLENGTFTLTEPLAIPEDIDSGAEVQSVATGELTLHGVTNEVTVDLEARLVGDQAVVVGSSPVALTDYGIEPPTGAAVLSVDNEGEFEFQVFFSR